MTGVRYSCCRWSRLGLAALPIVLLLATANLAAQAQQLKITSPTDGAAIVPGETIHIVAAAEVGTVLQQVAIVGESPLGFSEIATTSPFQFTLAVPVDIQPGRYALTALGRTVAGQTVESEPISVTIDRGDAPTRLSATPDRMRLAVGQHAPLRVQAAFGDGTSLDVTHSSRVAFGSTNSTVATVDESGTVTAATPGTTTLTVSYRVQQTTIPVSVPVTVYTPPLFPSPLALSFAGQPVRTASSAQSLTLTNKTSGPISLIEIRADGDFSNTTECPSTVSIGPGEACTVSVTFTPTQSG